MRSAIFVSGIHQHRRHRIRLPHSRLLDLWLFPRVLISSAREDDSICWFKPIHGQRQTMWATLAAARAPLQVVDSQSASKCSKTRHSRSWFYDRAMGYESMEAAPRPSCVQFPSDRGSLARQSFQYHHAMSSELGCLHNAEILVH